MAHQNLVLFRGRHELAFNPEFGPQTLKYLRAVDGDLTHFELDRQQIAETALPILDQIRSGLPVTCTVVFADDAGQSFLPLRSCTIFDCQPVGESGRLKLFLAVGPFLRASGSPDCSLDWASPPGDLPPASYLVPWQSGWPHLEELPYDESVTRWREGIDFVTNHWPVAFAGRAFLRLDGSNIAGYREADGRAGIEMIADHQEPLELHISSYNPHLDREYVNSLSLTVEVLGGQTLDVLSGSGEPLEKDGQLNVRIVPCDPGLARFKIGVQPQDTHHTMLPIRIHVLTASTGHATPTVILGREWRRCLVGLDAELAGEPKRHLQVLKLLGEAFPRDSVIALHRGRAHYREGQYAEALEAFRLSLSLYGNQETAAWAVLAALRLGDPTEAARCQPKPVFKIDTFRELQDCVAALSESVAVGFLPIGLRLLPGWESQFVDTVRHGIRTEQAILQVADVVWTDFDRNEAFEILLGALNENPGFGRLQETVVERAIELDRVDLAPVGSLRWRSGEPPRQLIARLRQLEGRVSPDMLVHLALTNGRLVIGDPEGGAAAAVELGFWAAELAKRQGDFVAAAEALALVSGNLPALADAIEQTVWAEQLQTVTADITEAIDRVRPVADAVDDLADAQYEAVRPWLRGRTVIVWGAQSRLPEVEERMSVRLGSKVLWLTYDELDERRLRNHRPETIVVIFVTGNMPHLKKNTKAWLDEHHVPVVYPSGSGERSILAGLDLLRRTLSQAHGGSAATAS